MNNFAVAKLTRQTFRMLNDFRHIFVSVVVVQCLMLMLYIIHSFHHICGHTFTLRWDITSCTSHAQLFTQENSSRSDAVF